MKRCDMNEVFIFKVRDYTTALLGRRLMRDCECVYYVQRGDGERYEYEDYRVEWAKRLMVDESSASIVKESQDAIKKEFPNFRAVPDVK